MCVWFFVVWRMGFARISAVLASSFSVVTVMVVCCSTRGSVFSVVSTIRSLWVCMSFSILGLGGVGGCFL